MANVVIIDDNLAQVQAVIAELKAPDFNTTSLETADAGYDYLLANHQSVDLLILDYHLPEMSGIDILRKLVDNNIEYHFPVLMLTSESEVPGSEIKRLNVVSWIVKPITEGRWVDIASKTMEFFKK